MDVLEFADLLFRPITNIGHLREELNNILGDSIWYNI